MDELSERAYRGVKALILDGAFRMGEKLGESRLAARLGLSRTPVHAALIRLEAEGLVVYAARRGHRMATYRPGDVQEIYACRALLESEAVRLVAHRGVPLAEAARLTSLVQAMDALLAREADLEAAELRAEFLRLNHEFHGRLYDLQGNAHLGKLIRQVTELPRVVRHYFNFSAEQLHDSHRAHQSILRAVLARDGERAAALMREHIWAARDRMLMAGAPAPRERRATRLTAAARGGATGLTAREVRGR